MIRFELDSKVLHIASLTCRKLRKAQFGSAIPYQMDEKRAVILRRLRRRKLQQVPEFRRQIRQGKQLSI